MIKRLTRITCRQAHMLLSERMDRPLSPFGRYRLYLHLKACDLCSRVDRQFDLIRHAVRRLGE
jgi:hypothetical protein